LKSINTLGKPFLKIKGFQLWVHGRQFPDASDYWDGNWLLTTTHCGSSNSDVWIISDPFIHIPELERFKSELEEFIKGSIYKAGLATLETSLFIELEVKPDEIQMKVNITPDRIKENHEYLFLVSKNDLDGLITELNELLNQYPIKGKP
jgi:hypothetical protein